VIAARALASAHLNLGRYDEAFDALNRANSMLPKENIQQHAAILRTFGTLFRARGYLNESLAYQQEAYTLAQQGGDKREQGRVLSVLSTIALDRGDFSTALTYCERVLEQNRQDDNTYYQILDLRQMASIYRTLFAYNKALELCDEAEPLQQRIRYRDPLLDANRALCMISLGQSDTGIRMLRALAATEYQNPAIRQKVHLSLVMGLAMLGDYEACLERARLLAEESYNHNIILYGRSMLWQGIAQNALQDEHALNTIKDAMDYELTYAGRYAWLCYYTLGTATPRPAEARYWYDQAYGTLLTMANSLHTRPALRQGLLSADITRWLADMSEPPDTLSRPQTA
jgi:tetratricopeptide (TPR) repeat protein